MVIAVRSTKMGYPFVGRDDLQVSAHTDSYGQANSSVPGYHNHPSLHKDWNCRYMPGAHCTSLKLPRGALRT